MLQPEAVQLGEGGQLRRQRACELRIPQAQDLEVRQRAAPNNTTAASRRKAPGGGEGGGQLIQ